jgi:hypothetical protein
MKLLYLGFVILLSVHVMDATAQDIIKLKDSTELNVKIIAVTPTRVFYKVPVNRRKFVMKRSAIEKIIYGNGMTEIAGNDAHSRNHHSTLRVHKNTIYGKNIISISPFRINDESGGNSKGNLPPGVGLYYEHILDKKGKFSFYLPLTLSFYSIYNETYDDNGLRGHINFTQKEGTHAFFMMAPGIKFYPDGTNHRLTYNLGTSLVIGFGRKYNTALVYTNYGPVPLQGNPGLFKDSTTAVAINESKPVFKAGLLLTNGVNFMATKHIYTAVELGLGLAFSNNEYEYDHNFTGDGTFYNLMFEFNVKVGYRF